MLLYPLADWEERMVKAFKIFAVVVAVAAGLYFGLILIGSLVE